MNLPTLPPSCDGYAWRTEPPADFSPWGAPDRVELLVEGIYCVDTPGHGGLWLDPCRTWSMPEEARRFAALWSHHMGPQWWEEDIAAGFVALAFGADLLGDRWTKEAAADIATTLRRVVERDRAALWHLPERERLLAWITECEAAA